MKLRSKGQTIALTCGFVVVMAVMVVMVIRYYISDRDEPNQTTKLQIPFEVDCTSASNDCLFGVVRREVHVDRTFEVIRDYQVVGGACAVVMRVNGLPPVTVKGTHCPD